MRRNDRESREVRRTILLVLLLLLATGCSSIKLTNRQEYRGEKLARPDRIYVHDFAATAADLPTWSEAASTYAGKQANASTEELAAARKLGIQMTTELVAQIDEMGLDADRADGQTKPSPGDVVLVGFLGSVDEGSSFKRVVIGFGSGSAQVTSHVEGYLATESGYRKLGSGDADSGTGRAPGVVLPVAVTIATANPIGLIVMAPIKVGTEMSGRNKIEGIGKRMASEVAEALEKKFREQGWIEP